MTIEVRQMLIKSNVGGGEASGGGSDSGPSLAQITDWREEMRRELLAECKAWIEDRLKRERER